MRLTFICIRHGSSAFWMICSVLVSTEDVVEKSNLKSYRAPYALQKSMIILDEDWYDYLMENYDNVYFVHYIQMYHFLLLQQFLNTNTFFACYFHHINTATYVFDVYGALGVVWSNVLQLSPFHVVDVYSLNGGF